MSFTKLKREGTIRIRGSIPNLR